ncbi:hypothetical protein BGZ51_007669, partial [Haplosporangium sp. Z 767]
DMDEKRYRGSEYTYSVPRTINERTHLQPFYVFRPPAETPQRVVPSQFSYIYQSPIDTSPRVLPTRPSTSFDAAVDPRLTRYTTPIDLFPAVVDTRRPTSESLTTVAERQLIHVAWKPAHKIPAHIPRQEVDGMFLHASVIEEVDDRYLYDQQIKTDSALFSATRSVVGVFKCYNCKRKKHRPEEPRIWTSNAICVEIWMSPTDHRYRTQLNSQMCKLCHKFVEPDVFKDDYVTKVVKVLDGWTGQCSRVKPLQHYPPTGPHMTDKCYACWKGICHQKPTK